MLGGRARLPVLAEIAGPAGAHERPWSLRREDLAALEGLLPRLQGSRSLLVTGVEGATVALAVALAGVASSRGLRAAVLECDLTRPRLAADLGLAPQPGLHEYLRWEATAPELLQPLVLAGPASGEAREALVCIAAGRPAENPAALLGLQSFAHMTAKLRNAYELLVLAGPPLGGERAALAAVAARADAALAAFTPQLNGRRGRRAVRAALRGLPPAPLGAVVVGAAPDQRS